MRDGVSIAIGRTPRTGQSERTADIHVFLLGNETDLALHHHHTISYLSRVARSGPMFGLHAWTTRINNTTSHARTYRHVDR